MNVSVLTDWLCIDLRWLIYITVKIPVSINGQYKYNQYDLQNKYIHFYMLYQNIPNIQYLNKELEILVLVKA